MRKVSKNFAALIIILLCVGFVFGVKLSIKLFAKNEIGGALGRAKGNKDAPIKIIEFIDFQCPACAKGAAYLKEKTKEYPSQLRVEVRHYPLQMHRHGFLSSQYAECASRQGKFWSFQDLLVARQSNWSKLFNAKAAFEKIAEEVGLNKGELEACLSDETIDKAIMKDKEEGKGLGVKSTPSYFINGEMVVGSKTLKVKMAELLGEDTDE